MRRTAIPSVVLLGLVVATPIPARALEVSLETSLGATIPAGPIFTSLIQPYDLRPLRQTNPSIPDHKGNLLFNLNNSPGFSFALALLLNDFELRYGLSMLGWKNREYTHISFSRFNGVDLPSQGSLTPDALFIPFKSFRGANEEVDISGRGFAPLLLHSITIGYRFTLYRSDIVEPYIPVAFGLAIAGGGIGETLLGSSFQLGLGMEFKVTERISLGFDVRYNWILLQNLSSASIINDPSASSIGAILTGNLSALQGVVTSAHLVVMHVTTKFNF